MAQRDPSPNRKRKGREDAPRRPRRERVPAAGEESPSAQTPPSGADPDARDPVRAADDVGAGQASPAGDATDAPRVDADERTAEFLLADILADLELASVSALVEEFGPRGDAVLVEALGGPPGEYLAERAFHRLHAAFGRRTFPDAGEQRRFLLALQRVAEVQADLPIDGDADASPDGADFDAFLDELGDLVLAAQARGRSPSALDGAAGAVSPPGATAVDDPYWPVDELAVLHARELGLRALAAYDRADAETSLLLCALALVLDARAVDAHLVAALVLSESSLELVGRLQRVADLGERTLGADFLQAQAGFLGELFLARPWLRARQSLGQALWEAGRRRESATLDEATAAFDPDDHLGLRYDLLSHELALGELEAARAVLARHPADRGAVFAWGAVIERRLAEDDAGVQAALQEALRRNRRALPYLAGRRTRPRNLPVDYQVGDAREAAVCADVLEDALSAHPQVRRWLLAQDAAPAHDPKALARDQDDEAATVLDPDRPRTAPAAPRESEQPTPASWTRVFTAALALRELAPWRFTDDRQLVGVLDAASGEVDHACVVGRHGGPEGLVLYRGALGLSCHARISSGAVHPADLGLVQRALSVTFEERDRLDASDLNALARAGVRIRERGGWPLARSWEPGLAPASLTDAETGVLARALEQCVLVLRRGDSDELPDGLLAELGEHLRDECVRVPADDPDAEPATWSEQRRPWPALVDLPGDAPPASDEARMARLAASGHAIDDTWSFDALPTSAVDGPLDARAHFVRVLLWISESDETVLDLAVVPATELGSAILDGALTLFERLGGWPRRVRVARSLVGTALEPLESGLGLRLLRGDRLSLLDDLCAATGGVVGPDGD